MPQCAHCGERYEVATSLGMLQCAVHPCSHNARHGGLRYEASHYDCCGASPFKYDMPHYELSDPKGCHAIDHTDSEEERNGILARPFVCVSSETMARLAVLSCAKTAPNERVVPVLRMEDMKKDIVFLGPLGKVHHIDATLEHMRLTAKQMKHATAASGGGDGGGTAQYYDDRTTMRRSGNVGFLPFYVVRRISSSIDQRKVSEVNALEKCRIEYL